MDWSSIPEIAVAIKRQDDVRNAAFLDFPSRVCGKAVLPMTLRHWIILDGIDSPFIRERLPNPEDVLIFLWVLSPKFDPKSRWRKWAFIQSCKKIDFPSAVVALVRFKDDTFQDSPPAGEAREISQVGFATNVIHKLAELYHWSERDILNLPLKRVFQYLTIARIVDAAKRGERAMNWSPAEIVKNRFIRKFREQEKINQRQ